MPLPFNCVGSLYFQTIPFSNCLHVYTVKIQKIRTSETCAEITLKWLCQRVLHPKDANGLANSVDPDRTARSGSILFAQIYMFENFGSLWYLRYRKLIFKVKLSPSFTKHVDSTLSLSNWTTLLSAVSARVLNICLCIHNKDVILFIVFLSY